MINKIVSVVAVVCSIAVVMLFAEMKPASANGIVYKNTMPVAAAPVSPLALGSSTVLFPDGLSLGIWTSTSQPLKRMSWGVINSEGTIANAGSGDWTVSFNPEPTYSIFFGGAPYATEPTCIFNAMNQSALGSIPIFTSMGAVYGVDVNFFTSGPVVLGTKTKFSFVCIQ